MTGRVAKLHLPFFLSMFARQTELDQVPDGGGKDVIVALVIGLVAVGDLLETANRLGDIAGDAWLFCYDKSF